MLLLLLMIFDLSLVLFSLLFSLLFFTFVTFDLFLTDAVRIIGCCCCEFVNCSEGGMDRVGVEPALRFRSTATGTMHFRLLSKLGSEAVEFVSECSLAVATELLGKGKADGLMTAWTDMMIHLEEDVRLDDYHHQ